ncbi:MAG: hypothetical protein ACFN3H_04520 [Spirochaetales bacterium]
MKTIIRLLILLEFAAIIFIPGIYTSRILMLPLFLSMTALVALYWYAMFWVSKKDAFKVLGKTPDFDLFAGKIPSDTSADLTRGRLCVLDGKLILLQRTDGKERKERPCKEAWSVKTEDITSVGFGKVLPARKGFILYFGDDEISFTCAKAAKNRDLIYKALGWNIARTEK